MVRFSLLLTIYTDYQVFLSDMDKKIPWIIAILSMVVSMAIGYGSLKADVSTLKENEAKSSSRNDKQDEVVNSLVTLMQVQININKNQEEFNRSVKELMQRSQWGSNGQNHRVLYP